MYIPDLIKGCFGNWALGFGRTELTAMNCLSVQQTIASQRAIIQCPKKESGTLRPVMQIFLSSLRSWLRHQIRVLKNYERQFFESLTLPLRELYGYTEIYRRVIYSKTAFFSFLFLLFLCLFVWFFFQAFKNHLITAKARRELLSLRVYVALTEICNLRHACLLEFQ